MQRTFLLASALALATAAPAWAQSDASKVTRQDGQTARTIQDERQAREVAQACLDRLEQIGQRMEGEGYWLTGFRGGWSGYGVRPGVGMAGVPVTGAGAADMQRRSEAPGEREAGGEASGPWAGMGWQMAPGYQIRTLYGAASILAHRGEQSGCATVADQLEQVYDDYAGQLREAGVDPAVVGAWRARQIAAARPVDELEKAIRLDSIAGTDLYNKRDEQLGSVEDVVLDPQSGEIAYAIVSAGGFLGIGERTVAVPWKRLEVTPGYNSFVLDVSAETLENAPEVDPEAIGDEARLEARRGAIDRFWNEAR